VPLINQDNFRKTRRTADSTPRMFGPLPYRVNKKYSFLPTSGMRLPGRGPLRPTDDPPAGRVGAPPVLCCTGAYQVADYNEPGGDFNADLQGRPGIRSFGTDKIKPGANCACSWGQPKEARTPQRSADAAGGFMRRGGGP